MRRPVPVLFSLSLFGSLLCYAVSAPVLASPPQEKVLKVAIDKNAGAQAPAPSLFDAAKRKDTRMLRLLLESGADPNEPDSAGRTPLFYSLSRFDTIALKTLIERGADPNVRDKLGATPLSVAKENDYSGALEELIAAGAYSPEIGLNDAVQANDVAAVTRLLDAKVDPNGTDLLGRTPLKNACRTGNSALIHLLVSRGADVNGVDDRETTPLTSAVTSGSLADVRFLLENGADARATSLNGRNVLMYAETPGSLELVRMLVEHGTPVRGRIKGANRSVLEILSETSDAPTLQYLLEHGAQEDINGRDLQGQTPLATAALHGNMEVIPLLLEKGANPNNVDSHGVTPVHSAVYGITKIAREAASHSRWQANPTDQPMNGAEYEDSPPENPPDRDGGTAVIRLLAKYNARLEERDQYGRTPMALALALHCLQAVQALQQSGAHRSPPYGSKNLMTATQGDDLAAVRRLLAKGSSPNTGDRDGYTPLMTAAMQGNLAIVTEMLNHGAKPDFRMPKESGALATTPLLLAAEYGFDDIVRLLLKRGANPNARLRDYDYPLHDVIGYGHWESARLLVEAGMDVNTGEKAGRAPLLRAARMINGGATMRLLLAKGTHVNGKFAWGITPLMAAAEAGRAENVRLLLRAGADIKARTEDGDTVLMRSVQSGNLDAVRFLLRESRVAHVDINARNSQRRTALSFALAQNLDEIARFLRESGAKE